MITRHADGTDTTNAYTLLSVLMLELWLSTYLPRATSSTTAHDRSQGVTVTHA